HVEGPFLNPEKKGAHNPQHLRLPSVETVTNWSREEGIALVTLAPELPGALAVIEKLIEQGVVVSAGHSVATYIEAQTGFKTGIRYGTHLFNAMPPLGHREPGLSGALLTDSALTVGLIPDGIHVHPSIVKLVWAAKGATRLTLVSDAMAALGMPPGRYQISDQLVTVTKEDSRLSDGTLAGSILSLDQALRNLITFTNSSLREALPTITKTPAALLNLSKRKGQTFPGFSADLLLLDNNLQVVTTVVAGNVVYSQ
ncbi:MAG: N-acetylglucosamine-6-phosphate deacetylase, partial [Chloroflexota bacterium]